MHIQTYNAAIVWNNWNQLHTSITYASTSGFTVNTYQVNNEALWRMWAYQTSFSSGGSHVQNRIALESHTAASLVQQARSVANERAEKLLQESLSAAQRGELAAQGFFTLRTIASTGEERIYRIRRGRSANVELVDGAGRRLRRLCAHPVALVPDADTMLAQKLMLESAEEDFLRMANVS